LAQWFAEAQLRTVTDAAMLVLSDLRLPADAPIVGAGIGEPVIAEVARRLRRRYLPYGDLLDIASDAREAGSHCAPAAALAILGSHPEARPPVPSRTGFLPA
jgi:hypothetical protein